MNETARFPFFSLSVAVLVACCQSSRVAVMITASSGQSLVVQAELADTSEERARGLMFRESLPEGEGMLFLFPEETQNSFWMKDTPISLDLIFIKSGRIIDLIEEAVPNSTALLTPDLPYESVLEVPGGFAARHGIAIGDAIEYP